MLSPSDIIHVRSKVAFEVCNTSLHDDGWMVTNSIR